MGVRRRSDQIYFRFEKISQDLPKNISASTFSFPNICAATNRIFLVIAQRNMSLVISFRMENLQPPCLLKQDTVVLLSDLIRIVELWISAHSASKHFWTAASSFALIFKSIFLRSHLADVDSDSKWPPQPSFKALVKTVCFGTARSIFLWYLIVSSFHHLISSSAFWDWVRKVSLWQYGGRTCVSSLR